MIILFEINEPLEKLIYLIPYSSLHGMDELEMVNLLFFFAQQLLLSALKKGPNYRIIRTKYF